MLARDAYLFGLSIGPPHSYMVFEQGGRVIATLWIAPLDSLHRARLLLSTPAVELSPSISPSDRLLAYASELTITGRDTLFPDSYMRALAQEHASYDVFPDGRHFLMMRPEKREPARLFVVVNWAEQLRRRKP